MARLPAPSRKKKISDLDNALKRRPLESFHAFQSRSKDIEFIHHVFFGGPAPDLLEIEGLRPTDEQCLLQGLPIVPVIG
jgi:hypothetical protein